MNTTNEYTDAQIQTAIDAAFPSGFIQNDPYLATFIRDARWPDETPNRLAIARAFLAALPKPKAMTADEGAPATSDPYARLKAYAAAGARIRIDEDSWFTNEQYPWGFKALPEEYEVHPDDLHLCPEYAPKAAPWTLPAPPPGRRWHREDWKPEWLEGGYRPLLDGEEIEAGDEYCPCGFGPWKPAALDSWAYCVGVRVNSRAVRFRTRRPLPAEASTEPEKAQSSEIAGLCSDCGEAVTHRPGKPGEFDHECKAKPADDGPPWIPHDGGPCLLKDEEVEEWEAKYSTGETVRFSHIKPSSGCWWSIKEGYAHYTHYRVLKWKPGHGPQAASKADEPATFEAHGKTWTRHTPGDPRPCEDNREIEILTKDGSLLCGNSYDFGYWGDSGFEEAHIIGWRYADEPAQAGAKAKPWTPRPGDVVRLKSGGPEMTVNTVAEGYACLIWIDASGFYHLCNATFSALTPAKDSSI
jgi:uncharacterized protein YodC (DUF2158 family)